MSRHYVKIILSTHSVSLESHHLVTFHLSMLLWEIRKKFRRKKNSTDFAILPILSVPMEEVVVASSVHFFDHPFEFTVTFWPQPLFLVYLFFTYLQFINLITAIDMFFYIADSTFMSTTYHSSKIAFVTNYMILFSVGS